MATLADVRTAIADGEANGVNPAEMVVLLDRAIALSLANGLPVTTYTIAGRSRTIAIEVAKGLRTYYAGLAGGGGVIWQGVEFER